MKGVFGLQLFRTQVKSQPAFSEVSLHESKESLRERIKALENDEYSVFKWMMQYFSDAWIAETLMLTRKRLKETQQTVFFKLGVRNRESMFRIYDGVKPETNALPNTKEIDAYIEKRTENEIRILLENQNKTDKKALQMQ